MSKKLDDFSQKLLELLTQQNRKLDKISALLTSLTLLQETVSPEGEVRSPQECAEIISDSFLAATAINHELESKTKQFEYHLSEFFIDEEPEVEEKPDEQGPPSMQFN